MEEKDKKQMIKSFFISDEVFMERLKQTYRETDEILEKLYNDLEHHLEKYTERDDDELYIIASSKAKELKENYMKNYVKTKDRIQEERPGKPRSTLKDTEEKTNKTIFFEELSQ